MRERRKHTQRNTDNRIERTYHINDLWYFELRGGGQRGPFESKTEMEQALDDFISSQEEMKEKS
ncbi:MAG: DUF6316 family protein [Gammaproteobacteria bacterium]|nr:DUF6316 family protein [Gammaproteobacteria bacterium]